MSINDFSNKIKVKLSIDRFTIICLIVMVLVGISSFGLGRLSTQNKNQNEDVSIVFSDGFSFGGDIKSEEKKYVASRNGKLYYPLDCSGAKRIADKNAIWFANRVEAERSGYQFSTSCK